jgi:aminoethylphosphonate catabolism LysR family transcriptional regulator
MRHTQLRAFHHVARHGSFSRAAAALGLTQPVLSDQVRKLEEQYEAVLFNRSGRQPQLTEAGSRLLEITNRYFEVEAQALEFLTRARTRAGGTLRIVADSPVHLTGALAQFRKRNPRVEIALRVANSAGVRTALAAYEADIGVTGEAPRGREWHVVALGASPLIAFAATTSPWGKLRRIGIADLAAAPLVLRERGSRTRAAFEAAAKSAGLSVKPSIEAEGREAVREIVAAGGGVGIVSQAEFGADPRLKPIAIDAPAMEMEESLVCLKERAGGRLVAAFLQAAGAGPTLAARPRAASGRRRG